MLAVEATQVMSGLLTAAASQVKTKVAGSRYTGNVRVANSSSSFTGNKKG